MRILLDTHILLWFLYDSDHLPDGVDQYFAGEDEVFFSVASLWETEIKYLRHKDEIPVSAEQLYAATTSANLSLLGIGLNHIAELKTLRLQDGVGAKKHHDPFDRILICQAKSEGMVFLTSDKALLGYGEPCVHYFQKKR